MRFIGIDLHYDNLVVCILNKKRDEKIIKFHLQGEKDLIPFKKLLDKDDYIAVEASTNTFWFCREIESKVKEIYVINTSKFSIISRSKKKTDKIDAKKIAKRLRYHILVGNDEEEFPTVYIPRQEIQELRTLFSSYELIAAQKTALKNRIYSLLVQQGINLGSKTRNSKKTREAVLNCKMPDSVRIQVSLIYTQVDNLTRQKEILRQEIYKIGAMFKDNIYKLLSIKGISVFTSIAILADVADVNRFSTSKKMCSYLRTAPIIDSSNKSIKIGSVNKQSRKLALKMLLQGLQHVCDSSPYLSKYYERKKKGTKAGKVRIAIARKVFTAIYYMLKDNKDFYWADRIGQERKMREYNKFLNKLEKAA